MMGQPTMARHEVVKQIWKLVKEKNLYDPKNKQFAICNDDLLPVIGAYSYWHNTNKFTGMSSVHIGFLLRREAISDIRNDEVLEASFS